MADEDEFSILDFIVLLTYICLIFVFLIALWNNNKTNDVKTPPASEDNLPKTGHEAVRRLLACKGKDAYSILGLQSDASDKAIKMYYRKQVLLVHPDKNHDPGAEEGFIILDGAFKMIGDPAKKRTYDIQQQEVKDAENKRKRMEEQAEAAMRDFFETMKNKMFEARNLLHCQCCGGAHKRILTELHPKYARFCAKHNTRHEAREGDVWAEKFSFFQWHYYACMEKKVYDITEWFTCNHNIFIYMEPNSHLIHCKIRLIGRQTYQRYSEANIDEYLRRNFFSSPNAAASPSSSSHNAASSSTSKGKRRRRQRRKQRWL